MVTFEKNMKIKDVSASFTTNNVEGTRDFYVKYINAKVTFDCGIKDPNGITLYLYEDREPSPEFQQYYIG